MASDMTDSMIPTTIDNFVQLCTVEADLLNAVSGPLKGFQGKMYYQANYEIVLLLGSTELKAQVAWKENVRRLPLRFTGATLTPDIIRELKNGMFI